jgi:hypothetical protein
MNDVRYFDEEPVDAASVDGAVGAMARRQLGVSLVVAFALLAAACLIAVRAPHGQNSAAISVHRIAGVQPAQMVGAPALAMDKQ